MATGEHFMCTDIEWDPTGRYVATVVTSVHQMENGFNLWSWNGNLMYRWAAPSCILWRLECQRRLQRRCHMMEALTKAASSVWTCAMKRVSRCQSVLVHRAAGWTSQRVFGLA